MQNENNSKEVQVPVRPTLKLNLASKSSGILQNKMNDLCVDTKFGRKKDENTDNKESARDDTVKSKNKKDKETKIQEDKKWLLAPEIFRKMLEDFEITFPKCFVKDKNPLALNIRKQLKKSGLEYSNKQIGLFLSIYCRKRAYKKKLILGAKKVDLNGEVSSFVTEEQIEKGKWKPKLNFENKNKENNAIKLES